MKRAVLTLATVIGLTVWSSPVPAGGLDQAFWWQTESALNSFLKISAGIPRHLLHQAECVVVIPSVSSGLFGHGGNSGRAVLVCRGRPGYEGPWGAPAILRFQGKGAPIGQPSYLLLVMTPQAVESLLAGNVELGVDVSVSPGQVPGSATLPAPAQILAYVISGGQLAGISLEGAKLKQDPFGQREVYGERLTAGQVVLGRTMSRRVPFPAYALASTLRQESPVNWSRKTGGFPRFP